MVPAKITGLMWGFSNLLQKCKILGDFWGKTCFRVDYWVFATFLLLCGHFCTNLHDILAKIEFMTTLFYKKKIIMTNHSHVNAKIGYFWRKKKTFGAENTPPRCRLNIKHVILYAGHLYQPFWTIKIRTGWQEGPGKVKIWHIWVILMGNVM